LKLLLAVVLAVLSSVAPLAGAWIETCSRLLALEGTKVAPLAGAWIETLPIGTYKSYLWQVAPLAGAWIETPWPSPLLAVPVSHPSRVRGLKLK